MKSLAGTGFRWVTLAGAVRAAGGALWCIYEAVRIAVVGP